MKNDLRKSSRGEPSGGYRYENKTSIDTRHSPNIHKLEEAFTLKKP